MKKAWIENNTVREICKGNPSELFHPDIAIKFDTDIPDDIVVGADLINGTWVNPEIVEPIPTSELLTQFSPIEFKMLFTSAERIALKSSADEVVIDFMEIINDARLTYVDRNLQSVKDAIEYLVSINILTQTRADEIMS